jgi:stage III sporulation protein SpoIIIAA
MDLGRSPLARFPSGDVQISDVRISTEDLEEALSRVGTFDSDNRAGINETLHRISCLRNRNRDIIGLTCRVGRSIPGSAAMITDLVVAGCSILLLGRPGMPCSSAMLSLICALLLEAACPPR